MPKFEANYRLIFAIELDAPDQAHAEIIAKEMEKRVYHNDPAFKYVALSDVKRK